LEVNGKIVIIVAPSGTGKSTLISRLKDEFSSLHESVSYTTRKRRPQEVHGVHYFFINKDEFLIKKDRDEFLEWALVHQDYKGTSKEFVESKIIEGKNLLFDLDVQGADSFKKHFGNRAEVIFIEPPSLEELEVRLRSRNTESDEVILLRLENAGKELLRKNDYDYCIKNDDLEKAFSDLKNTVKEILGG
jgi:guanylate kinase